MRFVAAMLASTLLAAFLCLFASCRTATAMPSDGGSGDGPLYLTPLIQAGRIDEARAASKVKPLKAAIESYSGYLTVDKAHGSNMFFWFFPAMSGAKDAPVMLWLQGGPGASSLYAVFDEHGPFSVAKSHGLKLRNHTWVATHSMLYLDNPVGTGYSFTGDEAGYSANQTSVGLNAYDALVQFFTLFHEYQHNDFYVTGESYAGKYVPAVSYAIHLNNPGAKVKINLKGLAIGNGMVDPINQLIYSEYLYQHGFVDDYGKQELNKLENLARAQILNEDFQGAFDTFDKLVLNGGVYPYPSLFQNLTGMRYNFNMLWDQDPTPYGDWEKYVQEPFMREALHVGQQPFNNGTTVEHHLENDMMQSVAPWLAALLDAGQYRVLVYSGQLDIIVPYRGTMNMVKSLKWSGSDRLQNATRTIWRVGHENATFVAGYATTVDPLTVLLVRDAGHMVPADQPIWGLDMINRFTTGKPF
ncbi:venom serine carboxypeptidase-like isoform X1 [Rhopalosiphum maidis]|uniref:venom serine carboxypeptidase-like isoform X1 n=2 Tax=Rhopalosiphum maidis TaxID=43146 RepID=UPI000F000633|nr:venom serine carboxypeptidase-like isoform X1 [Rhopalosiphum maidis]